MKIVGFNKKQIKEPICRLFAVCHRRQRALCRLPRTAKKARGIQLTRLVSLPTVADGKDFAISGRRQRTCHVVTCRWHHTADGKDTRNFAVSGKRQRPAVSHLTDWQRNYWHPLSLPSAADGKEDTWHLAVLPGSWPIWSVCLQWQTAKTLPSVADGKEPALCHQRQTAKNLPSSDV